MKILLLADYPVGVEVARYLKEQGEEIVGFVKHPPEMQKKTEELLELLALPEERVFDGAKLHAPETLKKIRALEPDFILSVFWGIILKPELIEIPKKGCINFHCSYLPYNRGKNPNVWPFVEGTPAGVTLHYIDPGVDSGEIIAQREIPIESVDTAGTLYGKMQDAFVDLFKDTWPQIKDSSIKTKKQEEGKETFHYAKDFVRLDQLDLDAPTTARKVLNHLRAKTFPPHPGAYFVDEHGKKVYVRVQLECTQENDD